MRPCLTYYIVDLLHHCVYISCYSRLVKKHLKFFYQMRELLQEQKAKRIIIYACNKKKILIIFSPLSVLHLMNKFPFHFHFYVIPDIYVRTLTF
jgi:hypothetical protein